MRPIFAYFSLALCLGMPFSADALAIESNTAYLSTVINNNDERLDSLLRTMQRVSCRTGPIAMRQTCLQQVGKNITDDLRTKFASWYEEWQVNKKGTFSDFMTGYGSGSLLSGSSAGTGVWTTVLNGIWQAKTGEWLRDQNGVLEWSTDRTHWSSVPLDSWQGGDGNWYRFDASGQLSVSTNGGINWSNDANGSWIGSDGNAYRLVNGILQMQEHAGSIGVESGGTLNTQAELRLIYDTCKSLSPRRWDDCMRREQAVIDAGKQ